MTEFKLSSSESFCNPPLMQPSMLQIVPLFTTLYLRSFAMKINIDQ